MEFIAGGLNTGTLPGVASCIILCKTIVWLPVDSYNSIRAIYYLSDKWQNSNIHFLSTSKLDHFSFPVWCLEFLNLPARRNNLVDFF